MIEREIGDQHGIAISLNNLGILADVTGDYPTAQALFEESLEIHRELGPRTAEAANLAGLGNVAFHQGKYPLSQTFYERSLEIRRQLGESWGIAISLQGIGATAIMLGNLVSARALHEESMEIKQALSDKLGIAELLRSFVTLVRLESNYTCAGRLWGATIAMHDSIGSPLSDIQYSEMESDISAAREELGEDAWAAAIAEGTLMTMEQAIEHCQRVSE